MSRTPGDAFYGPPLAIPIGDDGARGYEYPPTREIFPSITTCLKCIDKPALVGWAAKMTAEAAWNMRHALVAMPEDSGGAAIDALKGARYRSMNKKGNLGSLVHRIAEALATDQPLPKITENAAPYVDAFLAFVSDYRPTFRYVEGTVFSPEHRYAGTFDFLAEIDGLPILGDHKTGSGIYSEVALQLAASRYATELWNPITGDLEPMPDVAGCIAVHLQPEGYRVLEVRADRLAHEAFVAARELWPFACGGGSDHVIGPSLSPQRLVKAFAAVEQPPRDPDDPGPIGTVDWRGNKRAVPLS